MAEQPLSSDDEAASSPSAPALPAPASMPLARRRTWSGITLVRLAVLIAAAVIVILFATQWDRWVGLSVRQVTDDAYVRGDITLIKATTSTPPASRSPVTTPELSQSRRLP